VTPWIENRLCRVAGDVAAYGYDASGNQTTTDALGNVTNCFEPRARSMGLRRKLKLATVRQYV
jgi:hypothetical protein